MAAAQSRRLYIPIIGMSVSGGKSRLHPLFYSFLAALLVFRVFVLFSNEPSMSGDPVWYLQQADYIVDNKRLPDPSIKPYGFSLYLAALQGMGVTDILRTQVTVQFVLELLVTGTLLLFVQLAPIRNTWLKYILSVFILLQPFTAIFARVLVVEQTLAFVLFGSCLLFGAGFRLFKEKSRKWLLFVAAILLGLTIPLRSEMIAIVGLGLLITVFVVSRDMKNSTRIKLLFFMGAVTLAPFLIYQAAQYHSSKQLLYVNTDYRWDGYYDWLRTWVVLEKQHHNRFAFGVETKGWAGRDVDNYPDWAFSSPEEKSTVAALTAQFVEFGYDANLDAGFQQLADQKRKSDPIKTFVFLPLVRGIHYFVNLEGAQLYFQKWSFPKPIRYAIILSLLGIKMLFIALAVWGGYVALLRPAQLEPVILPFATFAAVFILVRVGVLVVLSPLLGAGLMESRYIYILWPLLILLATVPLWRRTSLLSSK